MQPFLLVSSDCHAGATAPVYRQFMETKFHDDFDRWVEDQRHGRSIKILEADTEAEKFDAALRRRTEERAIFGTDIGRRLERLEQEGIVGEVLFPEPGVGLAFDDFGVPFAGFFGGVGDENFNLLAAGHRAHNRWQADTLDHDRQVGLALISFHDVEAAVKEIHWAGRSALRGILLDGIHPDLPRLDDTCYDPMWSACEEENLPVHFHVGAGNFASRVTGPRSDGQRRTVTVIDPIGLYELNWFSHRPLWFLIIGGVCERHPRLRIVFTEMGTKWAPEAVQALDWYWDFVGNKEICPQKPSFYYDRQVFFGFSIVSLQEVQGRHDVGVDKLMWGSDHPHANGAWGCSQAWIRATFGAEEVKEAEARAMFGESAAKFYGLDLDKLNAIAARVGPTADDLLRRPDAADLEHPVVKSMVDFRQ